MSCLIWCVATLIWSEGVASLMSAVFLTCVCGRCFDWENRECEHVCVCKLSSLIQVCMHMSCGIVLYVLHYIVHAHIIMYIVRINNINCIPTHTHTLSLSLSLSLSSPPLPPFLLH